MALKTIYIPMSKKYKEYWGSDHPVGYVQFFLFGLLKASVVKSDDKGIYITLAPGPYWTKAVQDENGALFDKLFSDEDVEEIKQQMLKAAVPVNPSSALPDPPPVVQKRRGRPPKATTEAAVPTPAPSTSSDELSITPLSLD